MNAITNLIVGAAFFIVVANGSHGLMSKLRLDL